MPQATSNRTRSARKTKTKASNKEDKPSIDNRPAYVLAILAGVICALSAPGFDLWYLAWFTFASFFLLTASANGILQAGLRGLLFGYAYNLTYLNWYFHLHPLDWLGFPQWQSVAIATFCWFFESGHQAILFAIFAVLFKLLPLTGGFLPRQVEGRWRLPFLLIAPTLWVIFFNKLGNAYDLLGVPWSMIEYSQYRQPAVIQIASIIGGIGLGWLLLLSNCSIACLWATLARKAQLKDISAPTPLSAWNNAVITALLLCSSVTYGFAKLSYPKEAPDMDVAVIQGNINIEMQKTTRKFTLGELLAHYENLSSKIKSGLVIWPENSLPTYLKKQKMTQESLRNLCQNGQFDLLVGALDSDYDHNPFNSVYGVTTKGVQTNTVYYKRLLVPIGEYTPDFVKLFPEQIQRLTNTPAGSAFSAGKFPVVLDMGGKKIAPSVCFETLSPELIVSSVRNGGQLLVNLSDLAWFHNSMIGPQMTAFSVLRAVETGRYFIFAANTGPSVIINAQGHIISASQQGTISTLKSKVHLESGQTFFTKWFH